MKRSLTTISCPFHHCPRLCHQDQRSIDKDEVCRQRISRQTQGGEFQQSGTYCYWESNILLLGVGYIVIVRQIYCYLNKNIVIGRQRISRQTRGGGFQQNSAYCYWE